MENKQNKSTLLKDSLMLFAITIISGLVLGFVFEITKAPIEAQQMQKKLAAYQTVFVDADTIKEDEALMELALSTDLKTLDSTFTGIFIDEVNQAFDSSGNKIGYISIVTTNNGYGGAIKLALGYKMDGTMTGMEILSMSETADLGTKVNDDAFKGQFAGKQVDRFEYTKNGATTDHEVDAIGGATISTEAVVNAINAGIRFINEYGEITGGGSNE